MRTYLLTFAGVFLAGAMVLTALYFPCEAVMADSRIQAGRVSVYDGKGDCIYSVGNVDYVPLPL